MNVLIFNSEGSGQPATRYVTGFAGTTSVTLLTDEIIYLLLDGRYWQENFQFEIFNSKFRDIPKEYIQITATYTHKQAVTDIMRKHEIKEVSIDSSITTAAQVESIRKLGIEVKYEEGFFQKLREVKSEAEKEKIKFSQAIALRAFDRLKGEVVVGKTENYLAARLDFLMREEGAEDRAFETIIASGTNSSLPHASVTARAITESDAVIIDFGCVYAGYCCDFTRTILMPQVPEKLRELYRIVEKAQKAALQKAVIDADVKDIDLAARSVIFDHGYADFFPHATGHGVGMHIHELPIISPKSMGKLQKGHVITVEPGIYIPDLGGVRLEEMVLL